MVTLGALSAASCRCRVQGGHHARDAFAQAGRWQVACDPNEVAYGDVGEILTGLVRGTREHSHSLVDLASLGDRQATCGDLQAEDRPVADKCGTGVGADRGCARCDVQHRSDLIGHP